MNKPDAAAEGRRAKGPPRLRLHIVKRMKMLLLLNTIPIVVGIFLIFGYYNGMVHVVGFEQGKHDLAAAVILGACLLIGVSWWVIIPVAKWLYRYPRWYFRRESKVVWFLPFITGACIYGVTWIVCFLAGVVASVGILSSIYVGIYGVPEELSNATGVQQEAPLENNANTRP